MTESDKVWRIIQSNKVIDRKYSGGASNTVNRIVCQSSKKPPFPFRANIQAASFKIRGEVLIFLPDKLFVMQKKLSREDRTKDSKTILNFLFACMEK